MLLLEDESIAARHQEARSDTDPSPVHGFNA